MYLEHFGLQEVPFSLAPDPRYLYLSEQHREALAHLLYGVLTEGGFVQVTGEVGTGKTTVCRCFLERLPEGTEAAVILNPRLDPGELLAAICDEFRLPPREGPGTVKSALDRLNEHLLGVHARGGRAVLVIDEAQNLDAAALELLRLLTNLETSRHKLLQIVLMGQPELRLTLARPDLRQLAQRITARFHLGPLSQAETGEYLSHRLAVAGCHEPLFPADVVGLMQRLSGGIPRLVNILADRALLGAYTQGLRAVTAPVLRRAAREVSGSAGGAGSVLRTAGIAAGVAAVAALATFAGLSLTERLQRQPGAVAPLAPPPAAEVPVDPGALREPSAAPARGETVIEAQNGSSRPAEPRSDPDPAPRAPLKKESPPPQREVIPPPATGQAAGSGEPPGRRQPAATATPLAVTREPDRPRPVQSAIVDLSPPDLMLSTRNADHDPQSGRLAPLEASAIPPDPTQEPPAAAQGSAGGDLQSGTVPPALMAILTLPEARAEETAVGRLFDLNGLSPSAGSRETLCERARGAGLRCLRGRGTWENLLRHGLPGIVRLSDGAGPAWVVLEGREGEQVTLAAGEARTVVAAERLAGFRVEEYLLVGPAPAPAAGGSEAGRVLHP